MSWKLQKYLFGGLVALLALIIVFAIGVSFGASISHDQFINSIVPILGVAGSWVSGIGALAAVVVALWLAEKQRLADKENLRIEISNVLMPPDFNQKLMISIVSVGNRPSIVNSISIGCENAKSWMWLSRFLPGSSLLPAQLGYGQKANYILEDGFESHIAHYLNEYAGGLATNLVVNVSTNTENFRCVPSIGLREALTKIAAKQRAM